jgi:hypothetical protein
MIPVPKTDGIDLEFGNITHLPPMDKIPEKFNDRHDEIHCRFISRWFFSGFADAEKTVGKITPKEGIVQKEAIRAIGCIMRSWEPKHEHKIAGCGYLLSEWFILEEVEAA